MKRRSTARAIVLNSENRVLLLRFEFPGAPGSDAGHKTIFWATVGGAIEEGETFMQALLRELREETGLSEQNAEIAPPLWFGEHDVPFGGELVHFSEQFSLVRASDVPLSPAGLTEEERQVVSASKWWSVEELRTTNETVYPPNLAKLIAGIIDGDIPAEPRQIEL